MFAYYCELALRSLKRNLVLTALMIAAVGVGIGASMTALTVLRSMSTDPIPAKSSVLYTPQIDVWGPDSRRPDRGASGDRLPSGLTYRDALALLQAHRAPRQAAMYGVSQVIRPPSAKPFRTSGRATSADFFSMFDVPFERGAPWGAREDANRANVVVLGSKLAERLFAHADPVDKTVDLGGHDYRVVGVLRPWAPEPRFYDPDSGAFGEEENFFIPFSTAIDRHINTNGYENCAQAPTGGWDAHLSSSCVWIQFWAELTSSAQVRAFRSFLYDYAAEQRQLGRFHWPPRVELRDVTDWMVYNQVVPAAVRGIGLAADGFLVVCLINALELMLAKFASLSR
ncbi:MAG: ABC transporter permease, partial [Steroidobacteraceae bacterium]